MAFTLGAPASSGTGQPSLFGSSSTTPKPLFGNSASTTPSAGGGLFGGANNATNAPTTPSLFGGASAQPASTGSLFGGSKPAGTGLFGSTPAAQPASTGLFGSTPQPATTNQTATPTLTLTPADSSKPASLFGGNQTTQTTISAPSLGLFGSAGSTAAANNPTATASAPSGDLFGGLGSTTPATSTATPSLFGSTPASSAPAQQSSSTGLFGQSASAPKPGGLFGGLASSTANTNATTAAPSLANATPFGGSQFGGAGNVNNSATKLSTNQPAPLFSSLGSASAAPPPSFQQSIQQQPQPQIVPGVKIDLSNIKPTTRFFELHENLQKQIESIDDFIQSQISIFTQCEAFLPAHGVSLRTIPGDVDFVQKKLETVNSALDRDAAEISAVKDAVQSDITDARRVFGATETLKLPAQFQYSLGYNADSSSNDSEGNAFAQTDLTPYFEEQIKDVDRRLKTFAQQLSEVEAHLRTVDGSATEQAHKLLRRQAGEDGGRERVQELGNAMRIFEDAVLRVASKVGEAREGVIECTLGNATVNGSRRPNRRR